MRSGIVVVIALVACGKVNSIPAPDAVPPENVTVMLAGTGTGSVTSSPSGIDCGSTCTASFPQGTSIMLSATGDSGSYFMGWDGACSGTAPCTVTGDQTVTATFETCPGGGMMMFAYTGMVQTFAIPPCTSSLVVEGAGAQGGGSFNGGGGLGADIKGTFTVTPGDTLSIVVGQMGLLQVGGQVENSSGGGGRSFVYDSTNTLLLAAGGGGGKCNYTSGAALCAGAAGQITTSGSPSCDGGQAGGTGGNGGVSGHDSGGGTGWLTPSTTASGGLGLAGNWAGGAGYCLGGGGGCGGVGGFGGGGGGGNDYGGGGGGGGYSGGGGGIDPTHGGGGGSFNGGTTQTNMPGVRASNGLVTITW